MTGSGESVSTIERSAEAFTVVEAEAELFAESGSSSFPVTVEVFSSSAATVGVTVIVTVACAPESRVPRAQVTVAVPEQLPCEAVLDPKLRPSGSASLRVTPVAELGPAFETVSVYVSV